jgi:ABC-type nitrate/sulfonate/bicarbonate transport system permease component
MIIKNIFTPFCDVGATVRRTILFVSIGILVFAWTYLVPEKTLFPSLPEVLSAWGSLWNNGLFFHILATLRLCAMATIISIIFSCVLSYASTIPAFVPMAKLSTVLRYVPLTGIIIFFNILTGGGRPLQVTLLVIFMSFYFITGLTAVIKEIPEEDYVRRKAQRMGNWKILWKVVIKDRVDYLVDIIRQNLGITFMMIVAVEAMDKSQGGIGALLVDVSRALAFPKVFALLLTILIIAIGLDYALSSLFNSFPANRKNK